jgi:hypothetical protein
MKHWLVVTAGLCLAQPALAASAPPTTVMLGTAMGSDTNGGKNHFCSMQGGPAGFQRVAATAGRPNPPVILSLVSVVFTAPPPARGISSAGVVLLHFTSATGGVARFDFDVGHNSSLPAGETVPFGGYSQVWTPSSGTLRVSFNFLFPGCALPVTALFRTIP